MVLAFDDGEADHPCRVKKGFRGKTMSKKHDQIHIFIDESGSLHTLEGRPIMVGGVVILGEYGDLDDKSLNAAILKLVTSHGGKGFNDLHDRESPHALDFEKLNKLRSKLLVKVKEWAGEDKLVRGVSLVHKADIYDTRSWIMAESALDNRYIHMVWSLVEHLLFVDPWIGKHLQPDASVHLYVANRRVFYEDTHERRKYLMKTGQEIENGFDSNGNRSIIVTSSIKEGDIRSSFRMAIREKWPESKYELALVEVKSIAYSPRRTPSRPWLYVADLHLMGVRGKLNKHKSTLPVEELYCLDYNGTFLKLSLFKSRVEQGLWDGAGNLASEILRELELSPALASSMSGMRNDLKKALDGNQEILERNLEQACRIVDEPGKSKDGFDLGKSAWDMLSTEGKERIRNRARWIQVQLSHANHNANRTTADSVWEQFTIIEPMVAGLGLDGLVFRLNLRNRRTVSLMDQFRFKEAEGTLIGQIAPLQEIRDTIARQGAMKAQKTPLFELGAAFGTLGQILALQGPDRHAEAEGFFNRAIDCFVEPRDIERQMVYLGHLACDMGENGRGIWKKVSEKLLGPDSVTPVTLAGKQFVLAIQAKGLFQFGSDEALLEFARKFKDADLEASFGPGAKDHHPFGLIWQDVALCAQKAFREKPDGNDWLLEFALEWFDQSISFAMAKKQPLFDIMGHLAAIRKNILLMEYAPEPRLEKEMETHVEGVIHSAVKVGMLTKETDGSFSGAGSGLANRKYNSMKEKATALLGLLTFNYW